mmetsp:Transcript_454/g.1152  ORF Transcript_454/g.1152 Transcript_454/m.1152 type:complete len:275 (-) Transcript_454:1303-2127(-)
MEGKSVGQFQSHHHHTSNPEEDNVQSRFQQGSRVKGFEILRVIGPAHNRERKQSRRKPRIENVFVAFQYKFVFSAAKLCQSFFFGIFLTSCNDPATVVCHVILRDRFSFGLSSGKPSRDLVTPPQLSTDTPISDVIKPLEPRLFVFGRDDLEFPVADGICRSLRHIFAVHIPLWSNHGFQNISRTRAKTQSHFVRFFALQKTLFVESLFDGDSRIISHHSFEFFPTVMVDSSVGCQDGNEFQIVSLSTFVIIWIVCGCNLHSTCTKRHINQDGI